MEMKFSGERFVPGKSPRKIAEDHLARYEFAAGFAAGKRVLDIACGVGYGTQVLARQGGALAAHEVDISPDAIAYARHHHQDAAVRFVTGDICGYAPQGTLYDLVVCFETIEHVSQYAKALKNLFDLLRPGGRLLISSPNRPITSPRCRLLTDKPAGFHEQEFTIPELTQALETAGFCIPGAAFGQRQQRYLSLGILRWIYTLVFKPYRRFAPGVSPVTDRVPRYFLLIAEKP